MGYTTKSFRDSPLLHLVDRLDLSIPTYSNDQYAISVILDKRIWRTVSISDALLPFGLAHQPVPRFPEVPA